MGTIDINMRLIDLKTQDLLEIIRNVVKDTCIEMTEEIESRLNKEKTKVQQQPLYGIEGLAIALNVSKPTAQRWKNNGWLNGGYQQIGRTIRVDDAQKLRDIAETNAKPREKKRHGNRVYFSNL